MRTVSSIVLLMTLIGHDTVFIYSFDFVNCILCKIYKPKQRLLIYWRPPAPCLKVPVASFFKWTPTWTNSFILLRWKKCVSWLKMTEKRLSRLMTWPSFMWSGLGVANPQKRGAFVRTQKDTQLQIINIKMSKYFSKTFLLHVCHTMWENKKNTMIHILFVNRRISFFSFSFFWGGGGHGGYINGISLLTK